MWLCFSNFWFKTWTRPSYPGPNNLNSIRASASKYPLSPALPQVQSRQGNFIFGCHSSWLRAAGGGMSRWPLSGWGQQALIQGGPINRLISNSWGQALPSKGNGSYSSHSDRFLLEFGLEIYRGWAKGRRNREKFHREAELLWETSREQAAWPQPWTHPSPWFPDHTTTWFQGGQRGLCVYKQRRTWHKTSHLGENWDQNSKTHDNDTWYSKDRRGRSLILSLQCLA